MNRNERILLADWLRAVALSDKVGRESKITAAELSCQVLEQLSKDLGTRVGWIGVDLDGTLAVYDRWRGSEHIGEPIQPMVERVKTWLLEGKDVRIFTARIFGERQGVPTERMRERIETWCLEHIGIPLPITCEKDFGMIELWDDRCVQVESNTGRRVDGRD